MNSIERVQTRTECTMADLEAWGNSIHVEDEVQYDPFRIEPVSRSFPPCLGCGGTVLTNRDGALTIDTAAKTLTFRPCGCVLTVTDMPDGWRPA